MKDFKRVARIDRRRALTNSRARRLKPEPRHRQHKGPRRVRFYCARCLEHYIAVPDPVTGRAPCPQCGR